jgi:hypothetical protein
MVYSIYQYRIYRIGEQSNRYVSDDREKQKRV